MKVPTPVAASSPFFERETKARNEKVRSSIAQRLKKACSYLPDAEFTALVDKITNVQVTAERALVAKACLA